MNAFISLSENVSKGAEGDEEKHLYTIGRWHMALGWLRTHILELEEATEVVAIENAEIEMFYHLRDIAVGAAIMLRSLGVVDPAVEFNAEYERATIKHPNMTLDCDGPTDELRFYALAEEVGEVCAALTYDNKAATGHNSDLISEVTQVGGLAIAWLMRFDEGKS